MNDRHAAIITEDFPALYKYLVGSHYDMVTKIASRKFGNVFDCESGWFQLIYDMSREVTDKAEALGIKPEDVDYPSLNDLAADNELDGGMKVNLTCRHADLYAIVGEYEEMSKTICEECGKPGQARARSPNFIQVVCDGHYYHRYVGYGENDE